MIVELYGLPASGKSTFARSLAARGATRIRVRSRAALLWYNLRFFFRSPLRFLRALWWALASGGSPALRYYKLMNLLQYNARWEKARGVDGVAVLDQGHRQNVVTFFDEPLSEARMRRFVALFPQVDRLLVFDPPRSEREGRLAGRGYVGIREALPETVRQRWIAAYEENHRRFLSLPESGSYTAIESREDGEQFIRTLDGLF